LANSQISAVSDEMEIPQGLGSACDVELPRTDRAVLP
jgi:hypothetical protein